MADIAREYELVLMLDPGLEDSARDKLANDAREQISSAGELKHEANWGMRKLAYEIRQRTEADYRWFRFGAPRELLGRLDHNLKIADGVLRFRIFKVDPDSAVISAPPASGAATSSAPPPAAPASEEAPPAAEPAAPAEPGPATEPEPPQEPAEPEPAPADPGSDEQA